MKYKKNSIEVEAYLIQDRKTWENSPEWVRDYSSYCYLGANRVFHIEVDTASGRSLTAAPTWLIREISEVGCYPCAVDTFALLYEETINEL
jgi:hypothetical protein